ncbi:uncharacterized protein LOC108625604 isoform X1 [Ceratina calcarata]|uniref:Uncharacterized protein LOC108625604 isoform X1 n=1 Tax=Ceratina calcarata TaxID=156304 RepID=A0AAJ7S228_9HYME|nr:uncharacterized protein LOC108625604 isoform X1 [Ceratina calcarata]
MVHPVAVAHPHLMEHHPVTMEHHPVPMVLRAAVEAVAEDRPALMAHPPTEVADHRATMEHRPAPMEHRQALTVHRAAAVAVVEDLPALTVPHPVVTDSVVESPRAMGLHRAAVVVAVDCPRLTEHQVSAVVAHPPVTEHLLVAATDTRDHLRLTVHLAPVVAASEVDILEVEVDTLEAVMADTLEAAVVDIPEVVVTPVAAVATPEVVAIPVAVVAIPAAAVAIPEAVVATPVEATEATLEEAEVATLEEAVAATLEEAEVVTLEVVAAATPVAEVAKATLATEVTNINRNKSSPRATTFDHVSSIINHHQANQKYSSTTQQPKHKKFIKDAKLLRINGTSAANRRGKNEAESEVTPANSKSFATHPGSALKVQE